MAPLCVYQHCPVQSPFTPHLGSRTRFSPTPTPSFSPPPTEKFPEWHSNYLPEQDTLPGGGLEHISSLPFQDRNLPWKSKDPHRPSLQDVKFHRPPGLLEPSRDSLRARLAEEDPNSAPALAAPSISLLHTNPFHPECLLSLNQQRRSFLGKDFH